MEEVLYVSDVSTNHLEGTQTLSLQLLPKPMAEKKRQLWYKMAEIDRKIKTIEVDEERRRELMMLGQQGTEEEQAKLSDEERTILALMIEKSNLHKEYSKIKGKKAPPRKVPGEKHKVGDILPVRSL